MAFSRGCGARAADAYEASPDSPRGTHPRERYPVRQPGTRRRLTLARFTPVAVTTYGLVGPAALTLFRKLEAEARELRPAYQGRAGGWLAALVAEVAVHGAARMAVSAFSAPDGQERAHLHGRAAS